MKKYLLISFSFLFAVSTFFASVVIDFFGVATCQECFEAEMLLESLKYEIDDDVVLNKFMLTEAKNQELKLKYARVYDIPENQYDLYPLIFIGKDAFYPANMNPDEILTSMQNYSQEEREAKLKEIEGLEEDVSQRLKDRYEQFSVMVVLSAGLIDGINPCAFVVLIFLVSYLYYVGRGRNEILIAGLFFAIGIFGAYLAMGTGLLGAVGYLESISKIFQLVFYPAMAIFTGILAVLSILDFYRMHYKGKKAVLELSAGLKKKTHDIIRKNARAKTIWIASLVTGVLVSFVEFMCTGQVYLPTIVYVINSAGVSADALGFLVIYNLGFTVPVIAITLIAYFSSSTKKIQEYMTSTNAAAKIKLIMGALFTVFFIIMLNITFRTFNVIK
ncbi:MAG TPA: cytochrome C biogenesis protein CcdA [Mesotoga infera]|uniref:Cytochrome c biogenesis protein n=1 Tax=Mesotoga infera TaxID=1236046 RepID=A0A7Z7PRA0_9BACT|nr:cytochrome C biogenesis protein CcdA [Mesotoga infera]SSC13311.1 Cytochrome c biogenesis protein [Mesotoga infera]HPD39487.1 cytochrome C biogenesis protein CcdA [Mesotoga infera]HRR45388.1 cytochrome C biogenesis protein CcdA [Mesotoga sp.]HRV02994.1 cytochrome C biogenesis protein CcdA [Mesotoga sp.]